MFGLELSKNVCQLVWCLAMHPNTRTLIQGGRAAVVHRTHLKEYISPFSQQPVLCSAFVCLYVNDGVLPQVGQSYLTSVYTTTVAGLHAAFMVFGMRPDLVLVNGPGGCSPSLVQLLAPRAKRARHLRVLVYIGRGVVILLHITA